MAKHPVCWKKLLGITTLSCNEGSIRLRPECPEELGKKQLFCEEVGVVKGVHLLSGEVRSVATALKVVEEVQEEVQEIEDEWEDGDVEGNGGLKVEEMR